MILTKEQRLALFRKWQQDDQKMSYRAFRRSVQAMSFDSCVIVPWNGMWLGIERDGYTHS